VKRRGEPYALTESAMGPVVHAELEEEELDAAVRRAVAELPDAAREVFEMSRVQGLRYSEIASALGVSIKTVEARMGKALRELRGRLAKWLPERSDI
jgi:RNA polymerase sigma-70 factor (ECF subfamily)